MRTFHLKKLTSSEKTLFPYKWISSAISSINPLIHLIGLIYLFAAFNNRSSLNRTASNASYLKYWYAQNCKWQLLLVLAFIPEILLSLIHGWHYSICDSDMLYTGPLSGTVVLIWTFSKLSDLIETVLIVLEGRRPLPIHIIHHFASISYAFIYYTLGFAIQRWIVFLNLLSHVVLYAYLSNNKLFGYWKPCWVSVCFSQLVQLLLPFFASISISRKLASGEKCDASSGYLLIMQLGLLFMIIIFSEFYYTRICDFRNKNKKKPDSDEKKKEKSIEFRKNNYKRKKPSDETVMFEEDFPDLRSVIFSP